MNPKDRAITDEAIAEMFTGNIPFSDSLAFYFDQSANIKVAGQLREHGVRVTTVYEQGQADEKADTNILARARAMGCVLVASDLDFAEISERITRIEDASHAGIILIGDKFQRVIELQVAFLARMAEKYEGFPGPLQNQVYTVGLD